MGNLVINTATNSVKILSDNKDKVLLGLGLTAGLGTVVASSKATLKAQDIVKDHNLKKEFISFQESVCPGYKGSDEHKKDVVKIYTDTTKAMVKTYIPAVVLGATSVACIVGEHCIMQSKVNNLEKTVASLSAAYVAVDAAFKKYRKNVIAKYGEEEDRKLRYDIHEEEVEETNEKGKTKKVKKEFAGEFNKDEFVIFFNGDNQTNFVWKDPMKYHPDWNANARVLVGIEDWLNKKLRIEGFVSWNDLLDELGMKKNKKYQIFGWKYDPENPDKKIKLGINDPINRRLLDGSEEECMILEPNIDGIIVDI